MEGKETKEADGEVVQATATEDTGGTFDRWQGIVENYYGWGAMLPVFAAAICWGLFRGAHYLHPYVSLPFAILPICLALIITRWTSKKDFRVKHPTYMMIGFFGLIVALGIAGFASISYFLYSSGLAHFEHADPASQGANTPLSDFPRFYFWHFLKLLPIGIEDAWGEPFKHSGAGAGLPLVLFRVMIIIPLLALFKKWWDERSKANEAREQAARQTVAPGTARIETGNV